MKNKSRHLVLRSLFRPGFLVLVFFCLSLASRAQTDTTKSSLKYDFGFTRNRNVNLWPVFKRTTNRSVYDLQVLAPLFRYNHDLVNGRKHVHLFPFVWSDSSSTQRDLRILSLYYPSLIRISRDTKESTYSFKLFELAPYISFFEMSRSRDGTIIRNNLFFFLLHGENKLKHESYFIGLPIYWSFKNPRGSFSTVFPIIWNRKEYFSTDTARTHVVFPLYWNYKNHTTHNQVIFPLMWSLNNKDSRSFTFFPLFSSGHSALNKSDYFALTPLFWHVKSQEGTRNTFFPLFWNRVRYEGKDTLRTTILAPLYWSWRDHDRNNKIFFPFIWSINNPEYHSFTFVPVFSVGHSPDRKESHLILTPFFWHLREETSTRNILFPIYWSHKRFLFNDSSNSQVLFPLLWIKNSKQRHSLVFFPLLWDFRDSTYHSFTFFPLWSEGHYLKKDNWYRIVTPLFWHIKRPAETTDVFFPLVYHKQKIKGNDTTTRTLFFPLYWSRHDGPVHNQVLFPILWSLKNKNYHSFTFEPFFSIGASTAGDRSHLAITPLFWHFKRSDGYSNTFFPIWWNGTKRNSYDTIHYNHFFPVYWSYHDKYNSRHVIFPVLWIYNLQYYHSFTLFPFFSAGHASDRIRSYYTLGPIYYHIKNPNNIRDVLFPVIWCRKHYSLSDTSYRKLFFPVYWSYRSNNGTHDQVFFPLYWKFRDADSARRTVLFPLYWARSNKTLSGRLFFPLYHKYEDASYHSLTIAPFFSAGSSWDNTVKHLVVTPLFWHIQDGKERHDIFFPVYWKVHEHIGELGESSTTISPLYWSYRTEKISRQVFFPLVWSFRDTVYNSFTLFPLFSYGRSVKGDNHHLVFTPLFWSIKTENKRFTSLIPLFTASEDTAHGTRFNIGYFLFRYKHKGLREHFSFLWPVCEYDHDPDYTYFRIAPIIWREKAADHRYFSIQPIYYHSLNKEKESYRFFWELFTYQHKFGEKKSWHFLWRLIFAERYDNKDHEFRLLHLLFTSVNVNGNTEYGIFPFYRVTHEKNGDKSLSILSGFYRSYRRQIGDTKDAYEEVKVLWFLRLLSNYDELKAKGVNVKLIR